MAANVLESVLRVMVELHVFVKGKLKGRNDEIGEYVIAQQLSRLVTEIEGKTLRKMDDFLKGRRGLGGWWVIAVMQNCLKHKVKCKPPQKKQLFKHLTQTFRSTSGT